MTEPWATQSPTLFLALLLPYLLLIAILGLRRRFRGPGVALLTGYLTLSLAWFLTAAEAWPAAWPSFLRDNLPPYLLLGAAVLFWAFTRALLRRGLSFTFVLPAAAVVLLLIAMDTGLISPPPGFAVHPALSLDDDLPALLGAVAGAAYIVAASLTALLEYARRASPLHRNRVTYWLLGTTATAVGFVLTHLSATGAAVLGTAVHWGGAALLVFVVVQPNLPNFAMAVRRAVSYLLSTLIPALALVLLTALIGAALGLSQPLPFSVADQLLLGALIAGGLAFLTYQPLHHLVRSGLDRLFFGRGYAAQDVVRRYGQAVSQTLSLETLTATAMHILGQALQFERGTLLVVEEKRHSGWWLRVVEGMGVPGGQRQFIPADSPLSEWLIDQGAPLYQYTLDVDTRFEAISAADRAAWRRLEMEVFVPVRHSGSLVGLLALGLRRSGRPYTGAELALLTTLADQTAIALENASLFSRVQRRADQLALLNEIGQTITASLDLESTIALIAERIESAFRGSVAAGFIFLVDEAEGLVLRSSFGRGTASLGSFRVQQGQGIVGWVASEQSSVLVSDLPAHDRRAVAVEGVLAPEAEAAVCVPIVTQGQTTGAVLLVASSQTDLTSAELNLLDSIAAFASVAIENAQQVAEREARLLLQMEALRIEIDEMKRMQHVEEITDTDYFRHLQSQVRQMRRQQASQGQEQSSEMGCTKTESD